MRHGALRNHVFSLTLGHYCFMFVNRRISLPWKDNKVLSRWNMTKCFNSSSGTTTCSSWPFWRL